jgi:hypothetical protein
MFQRSLPILAAAIAACGLAGCGSDVIDSEHARRISRERIALLKQQPAPKCDYRPASLDDSGKRQSGDPPPSSEAGSNPDAVVRMKLDYERQCYRHAEMIARRRLTSLQAAVLDTAKAANRNNGNSPVP